MKHLFLVFFSCLTGLWAGALPQQKDSFILKLNKYIFQPGDTLSVDAAYKDANGKTISLPPATLQLVIENEQGNRTRLRWPVLNGQTAGDLILNDSLPRGRYTIYAALQQRFFEVVGKVNDSKNNGGIMAMLLTKNGDWDTKEVPVEPDGSFTVRDWLFNDNALMAFSWLKGSNRPLDIRISTHLDSTYEPFAVAIRQFYFGNQPAATAKLDSLGKNMTPDDVVFADRGELLPAVTVKAKTKSRAQQFDEEYSKGLFQTADERILDIMDDPTAVSYPTIFAYLQGRVAGLQVVNAGYYGGGARWRGAPVTFFVDEIRTDAQQLANIPVADIAIVKAYPPPFFGAPGGGSGGGIAVYTRRGGEAAYLPGDRHVFQVKGYTPFTTTLNMNKLNL
jgi:hypothetical protein